MTTNVASNTIKTGIAIDVAFTIATLPLLPLPLQIFSIVYTTIKSLTILGLLYILGKEDEGFMPSPTIHPLLLF